MKEKDMNIKLIGEGVVGKAKKHGAEEAEAYIERVRRFEVNVRNGEMEILRKSVQKGLGLRIFINKKFGFSYTSDLSEKAIDDMVRRTVDLTKVTEPKPWNGLPHAEPKEPLELELYDPSIGEIPDERKISLAREIEKIALSLDKRVTNSEGGFFVDSESEIGIFNSNGISYVYKSTSFGVGVAIIAGEKEKMQAGSWSSSKRYFKELGNIEEIAKIAVKRAVDRLGAKPVSTKKVPVIFDRYATPLFWMGVLFSLNGDSAYRKTTFMSELLGKEVASPLVTIVDNPTIPKFISSVPFDGEGNLTKENLVIEKGVLKMFFYDSITARKAGFKGSTIARRGGYNSPPAAGFLNIIVQNGEKEFPDLFKDVKEGFYCTGLRGMGTDSVTGNFSVGASGFWIENGVISFPVDGIKNGVISFPVDGITLGGGTLDILKNIDMVANDLDMRGSVNSPSFRVTEITVGGR